MKIIDDVDRIYAQLTDPDNGRLCSPVALAMARQSPETDGMLHSLILSVLACERVTTTPTKGEER